MQRDGHDVKAASSAREAPKREETRRRAGKPALLLRRYRAHRIAPAPAAAQLHLDEDEFTLVPPDEVHLGARGPEVLRDGAEAAGDEPSLGERLAAAAEAARRFDGVVGRLAGASRRGTRVP